MGPGTGVDGELGGFAAPGEQRRAENHGEMDGGGARVQHSVDPFAIHGRAGATPATLAWIDGALMNAILAPFRVPELRRYLLGLVLVFAGAWATGESGSMLPLACGAAAWTMLSVPLLRRLLGSRRASRRTKA